MKPICRSKLKGPTSDLAMQAPTVRRLAAPMGAAKMRSCDPRDSKLTLTGFWGADRIFQWMSRVFRFGAQEGARRQEVFTGKTARHSVARQIHGASGNTKGVV
jgi:hypothetical protein